MRLDIFLLTQNSSLSRTLLTKAIKAGFVTVNGSVVYKAAYKVLENDNVVFNKSVALKLMDKEDIEHVEPVIGNIKIVYEDNDLLVINKSFGISTHPSKGQSQQTLLNYVHGYLHSNNNETLRKHMVHRLDKDTSGLILFAKTSQMLWWLHRQFAERHIKKYYYALSFATKKYIQNDKFTVEGYLERSRKEGKKYIFSTKYGKWSRTNFIIKEVFTFKNSTLLQNFVLLECQPQTGRTHQIRVHLKHMDLPIWGDVMYSSDKQKQIVTKLSNSHNLIARMFLHAYKLEFKSYNGKQYSFEIPLNIELQNILNVLNET